MAEIAESDILKLKEFEERVIVSSDRNLVACMTTANTLLNFMRDIPGRTKYWERVYHLPGGGKWVVSEDDPGDRYVSKAYLNHYEKTYAKYKIENENLEFSLEFFKHIDDSDKSFLEQDYDLIVTLEPGQELPKALYKI
jgi:hypothetical protein